MHLDHWSAQQRHTHPSTHPHTHTHRPTNTYTLAYCHSCRCRCCCSQVSKTKAHLHSCWAAHCSRRPAPPPARCFMGQDVSRLACLLGHARALSTCKVSQILLCSNLLALRSCRRRRHRRRSPRPAPSPCLLLPRCCCQLCRYLTSAHYKAQESSRTTSSATAAAAAASLSHCSCVFSSCSSSYHMTVGISRRGISL